jgi:hypothetical protein
MERGNLVYVALSPPFGGYTRTTTIYYNVTITGAENTEVGGDLVFVMMERME